MTKYYRAYIYILLTFLCMLIAVPVSADKREKKEKVKTSVSMPDIEPDPIARKPRPDRHPSALEMPMIIGHGTGEQLHGIDVSHYQGRINWDEVARDSKVNYVYLKATEGVNTIDDTYSYNFNECKRVGLKVGSYLFFRPHLSPKTQFELFRSKVDTKKQDLLPVIDAEVIRGVSAGVFQTRLLELCDLFEKEYGKKPIIYTGRNFYNKYIDGNTRLRSYKFFIAAYTFDEPELNAGQDYVLWQYTATGRVRGIRGNVDMSRLVGRHQLRELYY